MSSLSGKVESPVTIVFLNPAPVTPQPLPCFTPAPFQLDVAGGNPHTLQNALPLVAVSVPRPQSGPQCPWLLFSSPLLENYVRPPSCSFPSASLSAITLLPSSWKKRKRSGDSSYRFSMPLLTARLAGAVLPVSAPFPAVGLHVLLSWAALPPLIHWVSSLLPWERLSVNLKIYPLLSSHQFSFSFRPCS